MNGKFRVMRRNRNLSLSHEIGHYLIQKFYNYEHLHQNEDFANGRESRGVQ